MATLSGKHAWPAGILGSVRTNLIATGWRFASKPAVPSGSIAPLMRAKAPECDYDLYALGACVWPKPPKD
jgi:hypothetical protein